VCRNRNGNHQRARPPGHQKARSRSTRAQREAVAVEAKKIRQLEREILRKDKALAETAALLVLQKKVQAIWGDEDDDTDPKSDK